MSYVQLCDGCPPPGIVTTVSLPVAELPSNVNALDVVNVKPLTISVQFVVIVHVDESTSVEQPEPPSDVALEALPVKVSFPLNVTVWSAMFMQFMPPGSAT
jgi:hypothetical protein